MRDAKEVDMLLHINKDSVQTLPLFFKDDVADVAEHCVCVCGSEQVKKLFPAHWWSHRSGCSGASEAARSAVRCAALSQTASLGKPRTASVQFHSVRGSVCYVMSSGCYEIRMDCNDVFLTM